MLIKFRTQNFKSFKDLAELDLTKGKARKNDDRIARIKNVDILKFASIFGANASGKSNLVRALKVMQFIVCTGTLPVDALNEYYKLDDTYEKKPTYFETIISISNRVFTYGFEVSLSSGIIESEWLVELIKNNDGSVRENELFSKNNNIVKPGKGMPSGSGMIATRLRVYIDDVENNPRLLLLNRICKNMMNLQFDNDYLHDIISVFNWFSKSLKVVYPINALINPEIIYSSIGKIESILKAFDTGVVGLKTVDVGDDDFNNENSKYGISTISIIPLFNLQANGKNNAKIFVKLPSGLWIIKYNQNKVSYSKITFLHDENEDHKFNSNNESDGTMRLFELTEPLATDEKDTTFVIDELDRCLHPSLTMQYVYTFLKKANKNGNNNQLIVTTHESRLLDLEKLRRDEIWFTEKTNNESKLYSLEEFNVRFDLVIDKAYMEGRYGGVPIFDKLYLSNIVEDENK